MAIHGDRGRARAAFTLIELLACRGVARRAKRSVSFTLIELLVVIAIIALLMAILTPVQVRVFDQPRHFAVGYSGRVAWGRVEIEDTLGVQIDRP